MMMLGFSRLTGALLLIAAVVAMGCSSSDTSNKDKGDVYFPGGDGVEGDDTPGGGKDTGDAQVLVDTSLSTDELVLGEAVTVTCSVTVDGEAADLETTIVVTPDAAEVDGDAVTPSLTGEYQIACQVVGSGETDESPAVVTVVAPTPAAVETSLDADTVAVYDTVTATCTVTDDDGNVLEVETVIEVTPSTGAEPEGLTVTPTTVGSYEIACELADGSLADETPSTLTVTPGPATTVTTILGSDQIVAGGATTVECEATDEHGNVIASSGAAPEPVAELTFDDGTVTGATAGEYEISCAIAGQDVTQVPATLTVVPGAPDTLVLSVSPELTPYPLAATATVSAEVTDSFGNLLVDPSVVWELPSAGLSVVEDGASVEITFDAEGVFEISAHMASPDEDVADSLTLLCDETAPVIVFTSPLRGAMVEGADYADGSLAVTGYVVEDGTGLVELTVDDIPVPVAADGTFETTITPLHGLNALEAEAMDAAGLVGKRTDGFYYSTAYVAYDGDPEDPSDMIPAGLTLLLGQEVIDDDDRDCGFDTNDPPQYLCDATPFGAAYDDMATITEVLLNNIDFAELADLTVYDSGDVPIVEYLIAEMPLPIYQLLGDTAPYEVLGAYVLTGTYRLTSTIQSVEVGQATMGDKDAGILGLDATDGGMNMLAYVKGVGEGDMGLTAYLDVNINFDFQLVYTIDQDVDPDYGVWEVDATTGAHLVDVTTDACLPSGALAIIDSMFVLFVGVDPNFQGYICAASPFVEVTPGAYTGATAAIERAKLAAFLQVQKTLLGDVNVTVNALGVEPLVDFLDGEVLVDEIDPITIDLSDVEVFGGVFTLDIGSFQIDFFQDFLADFVSSVLTAVEPLLEPVLQDLIICNGSISGCPLTLESYLETVLNGLGIPPTDVDVPAFVEGYPATTLTFSGDLATVKFGEKGGAIGLSTLVESEANLDKSIMAPLGSLLRDGCGGDALEFTFPGTAPLEASVLFDMANQAFFALWYAGSFEGTVDDTAIGELPAGIDGLTVSTLLHLPPVITDCNEPKNTTQLQLGAAHVDATLEIFGGVTDLEAYADVALKVVVMADEGDVLIAVDPTPVDFQLDIINLVGSLEGLESDVEALVEDQLVGMLLSQLADQGIGAIPIPSVDLGDMSIPGVPQGIVLEFSAQSAFLDDGAIGLQSEM